MVEADNPASLTRAATNKFPELGNWHSKGFGFMDVGLGTEEATVTAIQQFGVGKDPISSWHVGKVSKHTQGKIKRFPTNIPNLYMDEFWPEDGQERSKPSYTRLIKLGDKAEADFRKRLATP